jgi:hypothetical protein
MAGARDVEGVSGPFFCGGDARVDGSRDVHPAGDGAREEKKGLGAGVNTAAACRKLGTYNKERYDVPPAGEEEDMRQRGEVIAPVKAYQDAMARS